MSFPFPTCSHSFNNLTQKAKMTNFDRILRFCGSWAIMILLVTAGLAPNALRADSFTYSPDTVTFTPSGQDSTTGYVRIAYTGDSAGPGTYIHAWISDGSSYFSVSADTIHVTTYSYIRIVYHVASGTVSGQLSISDDTTTHTVVLIGHGNPPPPDGEMYAVGPYFPQNTPEGADTCTGDALHPNFPGCYSLRLINTGSDADTLVSAGWLHDPSAIFSWDSVSLPLTVPAHDTVYWPFCFNAPMNTNQYTDTFVVHYHDSASQTRYISRIVSAKAIDTTPPDGAVLGYGPYFPSNTPEGADTCTHLRLINSGGDLDTIVSAGWTHDPGTYFSWDTSAISFPFTLASHDTTFWDCCFHAPSDTELHLDTLIVRYHDVYSQDRYIVRIVYGKAVDTTIKTCYGMYAAASAVTNYGDTSYIHLYLHNLLDSSATLTALSILGSDDGAFRVDSSGFPITIAANTYDSVWLKFIPNRTSGSAEYNASATASFSTNDTAHCHEATVSLVGYMPQTCSDTESVSLDTTGTHDVSLSGDSGHYYAHRIDFTNNSSSTVIVSAVSWTHSSSHFLVSQIVPALPDTLAPSAGMAVIIHFYGDSSGTIYLDTLALTVQAGIAERGGRFTPQSGNAGTLYINFKGISNTASSVAAASVPNAPNLLLYPNPSTGLVNMELNGAMNATFEVIDVLGNVIAAHSGSGVWQWNASALGLPSDGTYFIRASNGKEVTTKRLVLQR